MTKETNDTNQRRVLAANMWAGVTFDSTQARYDGFLSRARPAFCSLVESIVLHDTIVVPTEDYLNLTALVSVLGDRAIIEMLERGVLRFCRIRGALAYVGNGGGVVHVNFPFEGDGTDPTAMGADVETAARWALRALHQPPDASLLPLVVGSSSEYDLFASTNDIATTAYRDFHELPFGKAKDPRRLAGVNARQVRILGGQDLGPTIDEIGIVLAISTAHLELQLMAATGSDDSATSTPLGHTLRAREIRTGRSHDAMVALRELTNVPDIGEGVLDGRIGVDQLLKLRELRSAEEFRRWFHNRCAGDSVSVARAYIELLSEVPKINSLSGKILRFIITTGIGLIPGIGGIAGIAASLLDSFVLEKLTEKGSAKFFVERLRQVEETGEKRDYLTPGRS